MSIGGSEFSSIQGDLKWISEQIDRSDRDIQKIEDRIGTCDDKIQKLSNYRFLEEHEKSEIEGYKSQITNLKERFSKLHIEDNKEESSLKSLLSGTSLKTSEIDEINRLNFYREGEIKDKPKPKWKFKTAYFCELVGERTRSGPLSVLKKIYSFEEGLLMFSIGKVVFAARCNSAQ